MKPPLDSDFKQRYATHLKCLQLQGAAQDHRGGTAKAWFKPRPAFTCSKCGGAMKVI